MLPNGTIHEVGRYPTRILAELHRVLLEEEGVEAFVASDDCGGAWAGLNPVQGVRLLVTEADFARAKAILAERAESA